MLPSMPPYNVRHLESVGHAQEDRYAFQMGQYIIACLGRFGCIDFRTSVLGGHFGLKDWYRFSDNRLLGQFYTWYAAFRAASGSLATSLSWIILTGSIPPSHSSLSVSTPMSTSYIFWDEVPKGLPPPKLV